MRERNDILHSRHSSGSEAMARTLRFWMAALCALAVIAVFGQARRASAQETWNYILPDSSRIYYTREDIADMSPQVLCYARNEIFARSGRQFSSQELQGYFNRQYWYTPIYAPDQFPFDILNSYEVENIRLLEERENQLGLWILDLGDFSYDPVTSYIRSHAGGFGGDAWYVDPDSYILCNSDVYYLSLADIQGLSVQELCYARNEIYARHGRMFLSNELSDYFNQKNWYWGYIDPSMFQDSLLNDCEQSNVDLLLETEQRRLPGGYVLDQNYTYRGIGSYLVGQSAASSDLTRDYIFWDSNSRYLTDADVQNLNLRTLCYARNEIYARRGYIFQSQELRDYFNSKVWYYGTVPAAQFSPAVFNEYEMANIALLQQYEYGTNPNGYQLN